MNSVPTLTDFHVNLLVSSPRLFPPYIPGQSFTGLVPMHQNVVKLYRLCSARMCGNFSVTIPLPSWTPWTFMYKVVSLVRCSLARWICQTECNAMQRNWLHHRIAWLYPRLRTGGFYCSKQSFTARMYLLTATSTSKLARDVRVFLKMLSMISLQYYYQLSLLPEYQPKCGDVLWLGSKAGTPQSTLGTNMWVAGKTEWLLINTCHTWVTYYRCYINVYGSLCCCSTTTTADNHANTSFVAFLRGQMLFLPPNK